MKSEGSARDYAPGHRKDSSDQRSENKSKDFDRDNKNRDRVDRGEKNRNATQDKNHSDRNATNERDLKDRNAKGDRDGKNESRNGHSSSTGASEGSEGRSEHRGSITNVTSEQKTRVKSVFSRHHVQPARNLNVSVNVGVALPRSVHLYPIPEDIVVIVPDYRGYEYIMLDDDRVAIVDPDTFEVVDIIVIA
jgi:hypothetical protein